MKLRRLPQRCSSRLDSSRLNFTRARAPCPFCPPAGHLHLHLHCRFAQAGRFLFSDMADSARRHDMVCATLTELGISSIAHRRIGSRDAGGAGLSGGERRRVSLAIALVACPAVLLLDEPLTGLDAFNACQIVATLSRICASGRTVLCSVHQPSSQVFAAFDELMVLDQGRMLYDGPPDQLESRLVATRGLPPQPADTSVCDYLLFAMCSSRDLLRSTPTITTPAAAPAPAPSALMATSFTASSQQTLPGIAPLTGATGTAVEKRQLMWLAWRGCVQLSRQPTLLCMQLAHALTMGGLVGALFSEGEYTVAGFTNRAGSTQFTLALFALGGLSMLPTVAAEWAIFAREWHAGYYPAWTFVLVRLGVELLLLRVLPSLAYGTVAYVVMGWRRELGPLACYLLTLALSNAVSGCYCAAIGVALQAQPGTALLVAAVTMLLSTLLARYELGLETLPRGLGWLQSASFCSYAFELIFTNELEGTRVLVQAPGSAEMTVDAAQLFEFFGFRHGAVAFDLGVLFAFWALGLVLVCLAVWWHLRHFVLVK